MTAANAQIADKLKFNESGLIPAIAQQHDSGEILMMAWMNRDALIIIIFLPVGIAPWVRLVPAVIVVGLLIWAMKCLPVKGAPSKPQ